MRLLLLAHRYLGIAVGLLMVMWCLSGVVMMYHSYPAMGESARLKHLARLEWRGCCKISEALLPTTTPAGHSAIEMLAGRPVLYLGSGSHPRPIDLLTGTSIDGISVEQAATVARSFAGQAHGAPRLLGLIGRDQWTVSGDFNADRPLFHFALDDGLGTELYVSSIAGRAVQITTARERFWNWLGAVPHWLYFSELRRHAGAWSQVVIYTSLLGCFLAGIGIYLGWRQLAVQPAGRWSPYHGFNLWHHAAGLIFGILTLSWVLSGLLSMNPWGWLESSGTQAENAKLRGAPEPSLARICAALQTFTDGGAFADGAASDTVSLRVAPLNGETYFIASTAEGERRRFDAAGAAAPLRGDDLKFLAHVFTGSAAPITPQLMSHEDNLYFSHHREVAALPVYRMILPGSGTRYYVDPVAGVLVAKLDANAQAYRWLHEGLHRLDFTALLRGRPQWDVLMLVLLSGVTVVCVTGAYLGFRRLTRSTKTRSAQT
jgi:PepSY-associated TM region